MANDTQLLAGGAEPGLGTRGGHSPEHRPPRQVSEHPEGRVNLSGPMRATLAVATSAPRRSHGDQPEKPAPAGGASVRGRGA